MKKILSLLGSISLIATSSAAVVACGDNTEVAKELTLREGVTNEQVFKVLEETYFYGGSGESKPDEADKFVVVDGKIQNRFYDTDGLKAEESEPGIAIPGHKGSEMNEWDLLVELFNETQDLKQEEDHSTNKKADFISRGFSLATSEVNATNFDLYIVEIHGTADIAGTGIKNMKISVNEIYFINFDTTGYSTTITEEPAI